MLLLLCLKNMTKLFSTVLEIPIPCLLLIYIKLSSIILLYELPSRKLFSLPMELNIKPETFLTTKRITQ